MKLLCLKNISYKIRAFFCLQHSYFISTLNIYFSFSKANCIKINYHLFYFERGMNYFYDTQNDVHPSLHGYFNDSIRHDSARIDRMNSI